ncbi:hypothetical protein GCM10009551_055180 [Nocardiopsis tropica]|uniref:class IV lanthionine synthetase LanL n=1 Tax=Nocardiopsis tropica TaxID=109330 RepID=UPI0031E172E6
MREHTGTRTCTVGIRERAVEAGRVVSDYGPWTDVALPGLDLPPQGWKIHVSARPVTLLSTVERVLPLLLRTPCRFKFARTTEAMRELNSHHNRPGAVGKGVTVYTRPDDFAGLAEKLAAELVGVEGPGIPSDRRLRPDAPVYYRYAPFAGVYGIDGNGDFQLVLHDAEGRERPGAADGRYQPPDWLPDPFTGHPPSPGGADREPVLLGGRFLVPGAIAHTAVGGVYRGSDRESGAGVVVKERRAYTGEDLDGSRDARHRLRGEAAVLRRLEDVAGVPRVVDHFRHGADEFLVTTDVGPRDLRTDVAENGTYTTPERDLERLGRDLLGLLDAVHGRGVLVRDLAPKNIVLADDGAPSLVDFEISSLDGDQVHGWTPGYSSPAQERGEPACEEDDLYSLGATLLYAATGTEPAARSTRAVPDDGRARTLLASLGDGVPPCARAVPGLMSPDPAERRAAADLLRRGGDHPPLRAEPRYTVTPHSLPALVASALEQTRGVARDLLSGRGGSPGGRPSPTNLYRGAAGVGTELLRQGDAESRGLARALAHWTAGFLTLRRSLPGLQDGEAGTALFLAAAARELDEPTLADAVRPLARTAPESVPETDYSSGLAGIGLAQLQLWRLCGDGSRLDLAQGCAERLVASAPAEGLRACPPDLRDHEEVTTRLGFAHGVAGVAHFLLCLEAATGDTAAGAEAAACLEVLAGFVPGLVSAASAPEARPMAASFCQGLTGIGGVLLRAGAVRGEPRYTGLAETTASHCRALAPKMQVACQCCGLAGVGEFLLDTAGLTGGAAYRDAAVDVAGLVLVRSAGTPEAPVFLDHTREPGGGWATGVSGVLSFLRRLDRGGPRDWLGDELLAARR